MARKLIIDGNAVYEIDENCMLKKRLGGQEKRDGHAAGEENPGKGTKKGTNWYNRP